MLAFAGWTRPEGVGYSMTIAFALIFFQRLFNKGKVNYLFPWLASILIIPFLWLIFSHQYVREDQVGGALQAFTISVKEGDYRIDHIRYSVGISFELLKDVKNWGFLLPLMLLGLVLSLPKILSRNNLDYRYIYLLIPVVLITVLAPIVLFYIESFSESDFYTFLLVSFDRAFIPAAVFITILAISVLGMQSEAIKTSLSIQ